jgi:hypothetical protein
MPKRTAKRRNGVFDPDYRRKGWRDSAFAPRKAGMSITQIATGITALIFIGVASNQDILRALTATTTTSLITFSVFFLIWIVIGATLRHLVWRTIRHKTVANVTFRLPKEPVIPPTPVTDSIPDNTTLSSRTFEHEVAWLFNTLSKHKAIVVGGSGDGGVDIKIVNSAGKLVGVVQCKRYQADKALAPLFVREAYAVKAKYQVDVAYLATTATFTNETRKEAQSMGIKLLDGSDLARMQARARVKSRAKYV